VNRGAQIAWVIGLAVVVVVAFVIIGHAIRENLTRPPVTWEHHHSEGEGGGGAPPDMKEKMAGKMLEMGDGKTPEGMAPPAGQ
jgi:hypothetical protein